MDMFESLFAGKRVAVVGPSPHLVDSELGEKIDSYDLVCRLNEVRPKGLGKDYGSKVDVMFWHLNNCDMSEFHEYATLDPEGFSSAQLLVYPRQHGDVNRRGCGQSTPEKNAKTLPAIPFYQVDTNKVAKWESTYADHLNVGTLALLMILDVPFQELFVCGFSFYQTKNAYHPAQPFHANVVNERSHGVDAGIKALQEHVKGKNVIGDSMFEEMILS